MTSLTMPITSPFGFDSDKSAGVLGSVPAWGSYLFNNYLLPSVSPSDWIDSLPSLTPVQSAKAEQPIDYFQNWALSPAPVVAKTSRSFAFSEGSQLQDQAQAQIQGQSQQSQNQADIAMVGADNSMQAWNIPQAAQASNFFYNPSIPTSVLVSQSNSASGSSTGSILAHNHHSPLSMDLMDNHAESSIHSPASSGFDSPRLGKRPRRTGSGRANSLDTDDHHDDSHDSVDEHDEHDHEVPEGVERDGMIWGMKVEDYRALSARERKRVRNRISARTFRAKRKEHLTSLEHTLNSKDLQIKLANEETNRLRREVAELKLRLARYEQ